MSEILEAGRGLGVPWLAEGGGVACKKECGQTYRSWVWPVADSQQGNRDLSYHHKKINSAATMHPGQQPGLYVRTRLRGPPVSPVRPESMWRQTRVDVQVWSECPGLRNTLGSSRQYCTVEPPRRMFWEDFAGRSDECKG